MVKIGDRVRANLGLVGDTFRGVLEGKVINTITDLEGNTQHLIEFDDYMNGHDGYPHDHGVGGRRGYCWYVYPPSITVLKTTTYGDSKLKFYFR